MRAKEKARLLSGIERLRDVTGEMQPRDAEDLLMEVLEPLLKEDGYKLTRTPPVRDGGPDFLAMRPSSAGYQAQTIGIEFKYRRGGRAVDVEAVRALIGATLLQAIDRAILLVNTRFTKAAREVLRRELPLQVELIDIDALQAWVARLGVDQEFLAEEVAQIISAVSIRFASMIAENPDTLEYLEWRDLERTVAEVFEGLGFSVTLTPPSKDGGKDIILECLVRGHRASYFVEIKHWRSRVRVGSGAIRDFLSVIARDGQDGGLFLSTYGYCDNAFEQLTEVERQRLHFGEKEKVVALCRTFVKAKSGIWSPPRHLTEVLYEGT